MVTMKNITTIGLSKNRSQSLSNMIIDCHNDSSTSRPRINPMTRGAGPKPWHRIRNPTTPETSITQTSNTELPKE